MAFTAILPHNTLGTYLLNNLYTGTIIGYAIVV